MTAVTPDPLMHGLHQTPEGTKMLAADANPGSVRWGCKELDPFPKTRFHRDVEDLEAK